MRWIPTLSLALLVACGTPSVQAQRPEPGTTLVHDVAPAIDLEIVSTVGEDIPAYPPASRRPSSLRLRRASDGQLVGGVPSFGLASGEDCSGWQGRDLARASLDPAGRYLLVTQEVAVLETSPVHVPHSPSRWLNDTPECFSRTLEDQRRYRTAVYALPGRQLVFRDITDGRWSPYALSPDGDTILIADQPGMIRVVDTRAYDASRGLFNGVSPLESLSHIQIEGREARDWMEWDDLRQLPAPELIAPESGRFTLAFAVDGRSFATFESHPTPEGNPQVRQVVRRFPEGHVLETRLLHGFPTEFRGNPVRRFGPQVLAAQRAAWARSS